jgi:hypothetical protein
VPAFPTPIGVDTITSISRRIIREEATDVYYLGSPLTWRLFKQNKVVRRGGFQIESRFIYAPWNTGGAFYGPEVLNVTPTDNEVSGAWEWKEYYTNVTLDQRSLIRADSEYAAANYVVEQCELAKMDLRDKIAWGIWSNGTNPNAIDGLYEVVDNSLWSSQYAGLSRASYPFLNAQVNSTATTLTLSSLSNLWDSCSKGARSPSLIVSARKYLTQYENLITAHVQYNTPTVVVDQTYANGGFSGGLFRGQPWFVDEHITTKRYSGGTTTKTKGKGGQLFMLNEDYFELVVNQNGDFTVRDFQQPTNQFVITSLTYVALNLICTNPQLQGKFSYLA